MLLFVFLSPIHHEKEFLIQNAKKYWSVLILILPLFFCLFLWSSSAPRMVNSYKRTSSPRSPTNSGELFTPAHEENVRFIHESKLTVLRLSKHKQAFFLFYWRDNNWHSCATWVEKVIPWSQWTRDINDTRTNFWSLLIEDSKCMLKIHPFDRWLKA